MLDNTTKKHIDDCRDVLVGKVPDPKSQIEQITLALIYKFMDDMDREAVEKFKGKPKFFTGQYAKYGWRKLFDPSLSGQQVLALYSDALEKMSINPDIPELFRNIFKNAYLPYRDPATLKLFLKHISEFHYSHSEKLGDAFEYLLSVMGSQGDAGQFRTPRHIIEFITACVAPQKGETVLDPACGTAGFLLSAYKYILLQNTDTTAPHSKPGNKLKPDERKKLAGSFAGYDISPDMVRLSLVNMYLHGFTTPRIYEYDTLSSEDRWQETYDVILANPPFMTPKGGIRPHKKFGVQANKAEVLFTDYIAEHLNTNGRAGIVVPNGIVATSQTAYKQLRRMLVQESLVAVVSLPAGVFQPYSGVKTSVLLLDKKLAKKSSHILFLKVENDGFNLGAQRREIEKNDLPEALKIFTAYKEHLVNEKPFTVPHTMATLVEKEKVMENRDVILSAERYFIEKSLNTSFKVENLGKFFDIINGFAFDSNNISTTKEFDSVPIIKIGNVIHGEDVSLNAEYVSESAHADKKNAIFIGYHFDIFIALSGATTGKISKLPKNHVGQKFALNQRVALIRAKSQEAISEFLYHLLLYGGIYEKLLSLAHGAAQPNLSSKQISDLTIPLPPLEIQQQIVAEIEGYQKIIDGAKQIVNNYKPTIKINPEWEMVELGEVCGINERASDPVKLFGTNPFVYIDIDAIENGTGIVSYKKQLLPKDAPSRARRIVQEKDVALSTVRPNLKAFGYLENIPENCIASTGFAILTAKSKINSKYLFYSVHQDYLVEQMIAKSGKGQYPSITAADVGELKIYLPPIIEQESVVTELEELAQIVNSNKRLIEIFEQKIKDKINEVWGVKE